MNHSPKRIAAWIFFAIALLSWPCFAQEAEPAYKPAEIEQLVAPMALYPDPLLAQILMASTYPLEIVSADRWIKQNPNLKGKDLEDTLQQKDWDASIKSLTAVPQVLDMLNENLDMTEKLGEAFLAQQKDVLEAIQTLRAKAQSAGNLQTNKEQIVTTTQAQSAPAPAPQPSEAASSYEQAPPYEQAPVYEQAPATTQVQEVSSPIITIEPADPKMLYVPAYDSSSVYGSWPYPDYAPYSYYPPYYTGGGLLAFGAGVAVGSALWGDFDWHHDDVNINVNRYNQFNRTNIDNNRWQHNDFHRRGVPYRDAANQQRFGRDQLQNVQSREAFRGRAEQGRQDLARGGMDQIQRDLARGGQGVDRGQAGQQRGWFNQPDVANALNQRQGAFDNINHGAQAKDFSNRGASSLASSRAQQAQSRVQNRPATRPNQQYRQPNRGIQQPSRGMQQPSRQINRQPSRQVNRQVNRPSPQQFRPQPSRQISRPSGGFNRGGGAMRGGGAGMRGGMSRGGGGRRR